MAVLSDFIVADSHEVPAILATASPSEKWQSAQYKGLSEVNLCQLWAILKKSSFSEDDLKKFNVMSNNEQQGPWAIIVPSELTSEIAAIDDGDAAHVADQWAKTEELLVDRWQPADVAALLRSIRRLATNANQDHKKLILWVSL
jgi:hypothetical protein